MKLTETERRFRDVGFLCGNVFLLRPLDAIRFVNSHENRGVQILGMEGFRIIEGTKIQPDQEHVADFEVGCVDSHEQARRFLRGYEGTDLWFEVVVDEVPEISTGGREGTP